MCVFFFNVCVFFFNVCVFFFLMYVFFLYVFFFSYSPNRSFTDSYGERVCFGSGLVILEMNKLFWFPILSVSGGFRCISI